MADANPTAPEITSGAPNPKPTSRRKGRGKVKPETETNDNDSRGKKTTVLGVDMYIKG
jgi:hypothetical protein